MQSLNRKKVMSVMALSVVIIFVVGFIFMRKNPLETNEKVLTINEEGTVSIGDNYEEIIINVPNVIIENGEADKVLVSSSVGDGDVTINNVKSNELTLKGGGANSIHIIGNSNIEYDGKIEPLKSVLLSHHYVALK